MMSVVNPQTFFEHKDLSGLMSYIKAGGSLSAVRENLFFALWEGWDDVAEALIDAGADLHVQAPGGCPTSYVISKGKNYLLRKMIVAGLDVNRKYILTRPLDLALHAENYEAARMLLEAGARATEGYELHSLLTEIYRGKIEGVSILLQTGIPLNTCGALSPSVIAQAHFSPTLPQIAEGTLNPETFDLAALYEQIKKIEGQTHQARQRGESLGRQLSDVTPLMLASYMGNEEIIDLLLASGAQKEIFNEAGQSALDFVPSSASPNLQKKLAFNAKDALEKRRKTAELFQSVELGNLENCNSQLEILPLLDAKDIREGKSGQTLLHVAAGAGHEDIVKFLLSRGAPIDARDMVKDTSSPAFMRESGRTPLMNAVFGGFADVANTLISNGAQVNAYDRLGNTPLMLAISRGHFQLAELLLNRGCHPTVVRQDGHTPLSLAFLSEKAPPLSFVQRLVEQKVPKARLSGSIKSLVARALSYKDKALVKLLFDAGHRLSNSEVKFKNITAEVEKFGEQFTELLKNPDPGWKKYKLPRVSKRLVDNWDPQCIRKRLAERSNSVYSAELNKLLSEQFDATLIDEVSTRGGWRVALDDRRGLTLESIRAALPKEFSAIGCEEISESLPSHAFIAVSTNQLELVAALEPNAANFEISTVSLIAALEELNTLTQIDFTFVSYDTVCGKFIEPFDHLWEVGELLCAICPELCEEGRASLPAYVAQLTQLRSFFLWWD